MRTSRLLACFVLAIISITAFCLYACTAANPTVQADTAAVTADQKALSAATTQAATQPSLQPQVTSLQQLAADEAKEQSDVAAVKIQEVQSGVQIGQTLAAAAPSPWGPIISSLIGLAGVGIVAYFGHASVSSTNTTAQTASNNHTAQIIAAVQAVADSVPVSALPANLQPVATALIGGVNQVVPVVSGGATPPAPAAPAAPAAPKT